MQKSKGKAKKVFKYLLKTSVICIYVALIVALFLQALKPGDESSAISNDFGNTIDTVVTELAKPQAQYIDAQSVEIISLNIDDKTFKGDDVEIYAGSSGKIKSKVLPENATDKSLIYRSSDSDVVKVYDNGKIVAKSAGKVRLEILLKNNQKLKDTINLTVKEVPVESIAIGNIPQEFRVGESFRLETTFEPQNTTQTKVKWSSSDKNVVSVDSSGKIIAKEQGVATITAKSAINDDVFVMVDLQVLPAAEQETTPVQSLEIKTANQDHLVGKSQQFSVVFYPSEATDDVLWSSSDETVAIVSQKGVVKYLKLGNVVITASCSNFDKQANAEIKVDEVVSSAIILQTDFDEGDGNFVLKQGKSGKITALLDSDATVFDVVFSSSDNTVAQIGKDGVIVALKGGEVTITATTSYGEKTTSQTLVLVVDKITFSETMQNFYLWVRKGFGHYGAFLVLGIFATFSYYMLFSKSTKGKLVGFAVCLLAGFAVAGITEILQLPVFTSGRASSFADVVLDFKGYCTSSLVIYAVIFIVHFAKAIANRKAKKQKA